MPEAKTIKSEYDKIEDEVRKLAHGMPPSDFGSTRVIQAVARYVVEKLEVERAAAFKRYEM